MDLERGKKMKWYCFKCDREITKMTGDFNPRFCCDQRMHMHFERSDYDALPETKKVYAANAELSKEYNLENLENLLNALMECAERCDEIEGAERFMRLLLIRAVEIERAILNVRG